MDGSAIHPANSPKCLRKIYGHASCVLNHLKPSIRILTLYAGQSDAIIECTLQSVLLDDPDAEYEALSYACGDPTTVVSPILVDAEEFNVTANLKDFLRSLRPRGGVRHLWVDAICINQSDLQEKISHLELMGRLYREASQVHIWLGAALEPLSWDAELAIGRAEKSAWASIIGHEGGAEKLKGQLSRSIRESFDKASMPPPTLDAELEEIIDPESPLERVRLLLEALAGDAHLYHLPFFGFKADRLTPCTDTEEYTNKGEDSTDTENLELNMEWLQVVRLLLWLLSRPWWYRVWTLQELILPRVDPIFHVGQWTISASCLLNAISRISDHQEDCCKPFAPVWAGNYSQTITRLTSRIQDFALLRREAQEQVHVKLNPLSPILLSSDRRTSDIRDHVYGILGLMEPGFALICQQKAYRQTAIDLFIRSSRLVLYGTGSLSILAFASANGFRKGRLRGLPSWAIDFRHTKRNHDPLCDGESRIKACLDQQFDAEDLLYELDKPTLPIKGIWVGTVAECLIGVPGKRGDGKLSAAEIRSRIEVSLDIYDRTIHKEKRVWMTHEDQKRFWRTIMRSSLLDEPQEGRSPGMPPVNTDMIQRWWEDFSENELSRDGSKPKDEHFNSNEPAEEEEEEEEDDDGHTAEEKKWLADNVRLGNLIMLYWKKHRFFTTLTGDPGLGPRRLECDDEIFVVAGFPGLLALRPRCEGRRRKRDESEGDREDHSQRKRTKTDEAATSASMLDPDEPQPEDYLSIAATPASTSTDDLSSSDEASSTVASACPPKASSSAAGENAQPAGEVEGKKAQEPKRKPMQLQPRYRTSKTSSFTLVGPCYMDGYMEGQMIVNAGEDLVWEDLTLY